MYKTSMFHFLVLQYQTRLLIYNCWAVNINCIKDTATSQYLHNKALNSVLRWNIISHLLTRTTPSVEPVITTFWESHSCVWENATHRICCIRSALPTHVFTLARSTPLMLHTCNHVPAQVAMSPCQNTNDRRCYWSDCQGPVKAHIFKPE
jgi:hypothetical protein